LEARYLFIPTLPDFDTGTPRNAVTVLASADVHGFHYDANGYFNELVNVADHRPQFGESLSISHALKGKFGLTGELWHFTQPYIHGRAAGNLWAVNYNAKKNLVFDAGFERGLTSTSTNWQAFAGFTYLLPHKLWH